MNKFSYQSMGTSWEISIWDDLSSTQLEEIKNHIIHESDKFDKTYSRFIKSSLIWQIADKPGLHQVPADLVSMLEIYFKFNKYSDRKINPLIGFTISDMGYDDSYSLTPKEIIRLVPDLDRTVKIIDKTHIDLNQSVLIDLGALGKGYFVDLIWEYLKNKGLKQFLVNGSGDIRHYGQDPIMAGLEHPTDKSKVIASIKIKNRSLCASGTDRRKWNKYNHVIDPDKLDSAWEVAAVWVIADEAVIADGLATSLFLVPPENFSGIFDFEYCIVNSEMKIKKSPGFAGDFF